MAKNAQVRTTLGLQRRIVLPPVKIDIKRPMSSCDHVAQEARTNRTDTIKSTFISLLPMSCLQF